MTKPSDPAPALAADRLALEGARKRSIRAALGYAPAHALPALLGAATTPILTRVLGPAEFGIYAVTLSVALLATVLASETASGALRRLYGAQPDAEAQQSLVSSLGALSFALSLGSAIVLVLSAVASGMADEGGSWRLALFATAATTASYSAYQYAVITLYVQERVGLTASWQTAHSLGKAAALVAGALAFEQAAGSIGAYAAVLVVLAAWLMWRHPWLRTRPDPALMRLGLRYGLPLVLSWIAFLALANLDRLLLAAADGAATAGRYSAGYLVAEFGVTTLITLGTLAVYPSLVTLWEAGDRDAARGLVRSAARGFLLASTTLVAVFAAGGNDMIRLIAGPGYTVSSWIPATIASGMVMFGLSRLEGMVFELSFDTAVWARLAVLGAVVAVPLTTLLVITGGLAGAAVSTAISYFVFWGMVRRRATGLGLEGLPLRSLILLGVGTAAVVLATSAIPVPWSILAAVVGQPLVALAATRFD